MRACVSSRAVFGIDRVPAVFWLALAWVSGCSQPDPGSTPGALATGGETPPTAASAREVREYTLVGEVRSVEPESHRITIRHEAIAGFMDAMTMPFSYADEALLKDLRPGDRVEGKLRVERENGLTRDYQLLDLTLTEPATNPPQVLEISGGVATLRARPERLEVGALVPDFELTGQDGRRFRLSDLRGWVVVLTFIYTRCPLPDFCPMMDRKFADLARSLEPFPDRAARVRMLSVSFDPDHDTPEILSKHAQIQGAAPPLWSFAVASHDELARVAPALGLLYGPGKNEIVHNLCTAVIDPEGKLARLEVGTQRNKWTSADLLKTIQELLPAANPIPTP